MNELQAGIESAFAVLPQPAVLLPQGKAALNDPTRWHDLEGVQPAPLGNLHAHMSALLELLVADALGYFWLTSTRFAGLRGIVNTFSVRKILIIFTSPTHGPLRSDAKTLDGKSYNPGPPPI